MRFRQVLAALSLMFLLVKQGEAGANSATLTVSDPTYRKNGQMINFSWSGIEGVQESDLIALVHTSPSDFRSRYPLNYIWVRQVASSTYMQGSGSAKFYAYNMRKDLWIVYLRYPNDQNPAAPLGTFSWGSQSVLASVKLSPSPSLLSAPHQLHLSVQPTTSRTSFNIDAAWQSTTPGGHALLSTSKKALRGHIMQSTDPDSEASEPMAYEMADTQEYQSHHPHHGGEDSTSYAERDSRIAVVEATSDTYTINEMCGIVANGLGWLDPGYTSHTLFEGLPPNTRFYYTVCSGQGHHKTCSTVRNFLTPPLAASDCLDPDYDGDWYARLAAANSSTAVTLVEPENYHKPSHKHHHYSNKACLEDVGVVKMLLAADHGKNNMGDGSWWADGQGFADLDQVNSAPGNLLGPLWPGKLYTLPGVPSGTPPLPIGNFFYSALLGSGDPAWGFQPASKIVTEALTREAASGRYHAALLSGDLAYSSGMLPTWDRWLTQLEGMLSVVPTNYAVGNHENAGEGLPEASVPQGDAVPDGGGECGIPYDTRLRMPFADGVSAALRPQYYFYTLGPVAIISLNTDQKWEEGTTQYNWLVSTLEKVAAERAQGRLPFLVVALHRPMYTDEPDYTPDRGEAAIALSLRAAWEPLFAKYTDEPDYTPDRGEAAIALSLRAAWEPLFKYEVDMTWSGHAHVYHRSSPVLKGKRASPPGDVMAPIHITMGNAGYQASGIAFKEKQEWIEQEVWKFGYCTLEAAQHTERSRLRLKCFDANTGRKFDEVTLTKDASWRPNAAAALAYYNSITPADPQEGIFLRSVVAQYQGYILSFGLQSFIANQYGKLLQYFSPGTPIDKLLTATPGTRIYSLADVLEVYRVSAELGLAEIPNLPADPQIQGLAALAKPSLEYILEGASPGGRLYEAVQAGLSS